MKNIPHDISCGKSALHRLQLTSGFLQLPSFGPKQLCALARLGCTAKQIIFSNSKYEIDIGISSSIGVFWIGMSKRIRI